MFDLVEAFREQPCLKLPEIHGQFYTKLFEPLKDKPVRLLEIGVWHGVSIRAWRKFFPNATLFGMDSIITAKERLSECFFINGDQSFRPFMKRVAEKIGPLDIVIDDGGHWCDDQQVSFEELWPVMNPGGLYIIEDLWVAKDRVLDGYEDTITYLEKLPLAKEFYPGNNGFEKDICVLRKPDPIP